MGSIIRLEMNAVAGNGTCEVTRARRADYRRLPKGLLVGSYLSSASRETPHDLPCAVESPSALQVTRIYAPDARTFRTYGSLSGRVVYAAISTCLRSVG